MRPPEEQLPINIGPDWDLELGTLDPESRAAADLLRRSAIRYQPSFRFQEALAARLRAGDVEAGGAAITMLPVVEPLPVDGPLPVVGPLPEPAASASGAPPFAGRNRSLLVSGAIASGVSLAGAIVAWRLGRLRQGATGLAAGAHAVVRSIEERT